jgi:rhamnose transport system permease protein
MSAVLATLRRRLSPARFLIGNGMPYHGRRGWNLALVLLIVATGAWATAESPDFLTFHYLFDAVEGAAVSALLALGLTVVVIIGEIDISLTSNLALCTVAAGMLGQAGAPAALIVIASLLVGGALGFINGALVGYLGLPSLAVTLGALGAYQALAFIIGGHAGFTAFPPAISALGFGAVGAVPVSLIVFLAVAAAVSVVLNLTTIGRTFYAIGRNPEATRRTGISVPFGRTIAFVVAGLVAGLAALVFVGFYGSGGGDSAAGTILTVVTIVALGGVDIYGGSGQISGVVLAALLLLTIQSGMALLNLSTTVQTIVIGALLVLSLAASEIMGGGAWRRGLARSLARLRPASGGPEGGASPGGGD